MYSVYNLYMKHPCWYKNILYHGLMTTGVGGSKLVATKIVRKVCVGCDR